MKVLNHESSPVVDPDGEVSADLPDSVLILHRDVPLLYTQHYSVFQIVPQLLFLLLVEVGNALMYKFAKVKVVSRQELQAGGLTHESLVN